MLLYGSEHYGSVCRSGQRRSEISVRDCADKNILSLGVEYVVAPDVSRLRLSSQTGTERLVSVMFLLILTAARWAGVLGIYAGSIGLGLAGSYALLKAITQVVVVWSPPETLRLTVDQHVQLYSVRRTEYLTFPITVGLGVYGHFNEVEEKAPPGRQHSEPIWDSISNYDADEQ